jgi:hypothetical protein
VRRRFGIAVRSLVADPPVLDPAAPGARLAVRCGEGLVEHQRSDLKHRGGNAKNEKH